MDTFAKRLKYARTNAGMSGVALAKAVGMVKSSISDMEHERTKAPTPSNLFKIAKVLRVLPEWLADGGHMMVDDWDTRDREKRKYMLPIIPYDELARLLPAKSFPSKYHKWTVCPKETSKQAFATNMPDDSMSSSSSPIPMGAILHIEPEQRATAGDLILAMVDKEPIVRRIGRQGGSNLLLAANSKYPTITDNYKKVGVVISILIDL